MQDTSTMAAAEQAAENALMDAFQRVRETVGAAPHTARLTFVRRAEALAAGRPDIAQALADLRDAVDAYNRARAGSRR